MARDYSDWLTKDQVAKVLEVTNKTVERMAARGDLEQRLWRRIGKPVIAVYHPDSVERARKQLNPDAQGFVVQEETKALAVRPNGALAKPGIIDVDARPIPPLRHAVELRHKLYLTMKEASEYSGLPPVFLERMIEQGNLRWLQVDGRGSKRIRRTDLENL